MSLSEVHQLRPGHRFELTPAPELTPLELYEVLKKTLI
jgi:hypothetical protein